MDRRVSGSEFHNGINIVKMTSSITSSVTIGYSRVSQAHVPNPNAQANYDRFPDTVECTERTLYLITVVHFYAFLW